METFESERVSELTSAEGREHGRPQFLLKVLVAVPVVILGKVLIAVLGAVLVTVLGAVRGQYWEQCH